MTDAGPAGPVTGDYGGFAGDNQIGHDTSKDTLGDSGSKGGSRDGDAPAGDFNGGGGNDSLASADTSRDPISGGNNGLSNDNAFNWGDGAVDLSAAPIAPEVPAGPRTNADVEPGKVDRDNPWSTAVINENARLGRSLADGKTPPSTTGGLGKGYFGEVFETVGRWAGKELAGPVGKQVGGPAGRHFGEAFGDYVDPVSRVPPMPAHATPANGPPYNGGGWGGDSYTNYDAQSSR